MIFLEDASYIPTSRDEYPRQECFAGTRFTRDSDDHLHPIHPYDTPPPFKHPVYLFKNDGERTNRCLHAGVVLSECNSNRDAYTVTSP